MTPRHQRALGRRKFLVALGGAAVAAPAVAAIAPHALAGTTQRTKAAAGALPLTIVNNSGSFGNASVHVYIVGNQDGRQVRVTPDGGLAPIALSDNGADGFTDYAISLAGSGETRLSLPQMSGRIYVSLGQKLKFKAVTDGNGNAALQYPAGWVSSDPSFAVLHDCAEFTYNSSGMFCNTTMVDMFSVPMSIRLTGAKDQTTGTVRTGGRAAAFAAVRKAEEFARLVVGDTRIIAPGHGLDAGLFAKDYFAPYIDQVWSAYTGKDLKVTTNAGAFTGRVRGGRLTFDGPASVSFDKPSTRDVLFCDGALAAPNDGRTGPVAA
ncbi:beta-1,3-glucanase family protein, partial [Streptomyces anandii]|uniref:beta-1,3-glucanase family protein n=1 Tax=Streptomyces anandii TaxID=285454 RepID=UPI001E3F0ABC